MKTLHLDIQFAIPPNASDSARIERLIETIVLGRGGVKIVAVDQHVIVPCEHDETGYGPGYETVPGRLIVAEFMSETLGMAGSQAIEAMSDVTLLEAVWDIECQDLGSDGEIEGAIQWSREGFDPVEGTESIVAQRGSVS